MLSFMTSRAKQSEPKSRGESLIGANPDLHTSFEKKITSPPVGGKKFTHSRKTSMNKMQQTNRVANEGPF